MERNQMWQIYDYYNLSEATNRALHEGVNPFGGSWKYVHDIVNTACSMFSYKGIEKLIPELTSQIIETSLIFSSNLCFYNDPSLGWVFCRYTAGMERDLYNKPTKVNLLAINGTQFANGVNYQDLILIRDSRIDIPPYLTLMEYISKMQWLEDAEKKVTMNSTLPLAIVGNKKQAGALKQVARELGNNSPFIIGDDSVMDNIKSFPIDVPVSPLELYDLRTKYRGECLASLGIYSVEEKGERLLNQEVTKLNDYTDYVYQSRKQERLNAIEALKKASGVEIELVETYDLSFRDNLDLQKEMMNVVGMDNNFNQQKPNTPPKNEEEKNKEVKKDK